MGLTELRTMVRRALRGPGAAEPIPELYELSGEVRAALRAVEMREPIHVAVRLLSRRGLDDRTAAALAGGRTEWFPAFMRLLELGVREGVWRLEQIEDADPGDLAMIRKALESEGGHAALALRISREVMVQGEAAYREAQALVDGWLGDTAAARSSPEAEVPEQPPVPPAPSNPPRALDDADETGDALPRLGKDELLAINVNQHTGSRLIHGWFEARRYLFLVRGTLGVPLLRRLTELGLILDAWEGRPAGPGLLFRIRAGERTFGSVLAIDLPALQADLPALQAVMGDDWPEIEEEWKGTRYPVTDVVGMGHAEKPSRSTVERTEHSCPRCQKQLLRKEKDDVYFVCEDSPCGFSVNASADGGPLPPDSCEKCGEKRYQTVAKGKKLMKHLHPCKQARAAA